MPDQEGDCESPIDKWYYSKVDQSCLNFMYGDCPRNENVFSTEKECLDTCTSAVKGPSKTSGTAKGSKAERPGKGGSEEKGIKNPPVKAQKPTRPSRRPKTKPPTAPKRKEPAVTRKRPQPPKQKHPVRPNCGVRAKKVRCEEDYAGMWYYIGQFWICTPVRSGECPTHGAFFQTCEECMQKCHRAWKNRCELMQARLKNE
ncbi:hypothetical protein MTO96_038888 [Rhipicephalus appendiculatus]